MALTDQLTAIGNAIRAKTGGSALIPLNDMPTEIANIPGGSVPASALVITGDCHYRFANNAWNWFITMYGNQITTSTISDTTNMFYDTTVNVPFAINLSSGAYQLFNGYKGSVSPTVNFTNNTTVTIKEMFQNSEINQFGNITGQNLTINTLDNCFYGCNNITELPITFLNSLDLSSVTSMKQFMSHCFCLRSVPKSFLQKIKDNNTSTATSYLPGMFTWLYSLDGIDGLYPSSASYTKNMFSSTFLKCSRINKMKFLVDEENNNTPFVRNWKVQTIDLSSEVGWIARRDDIINNTALTSATEVTDATSYTSLKNNPDWWTADIAYSRYNHDSAVETINSLPDVSSSGGTNTIKFKGTAGSATDGGAINTLTSAEIAVATAKGWTVTLV